MADPETQMVPISIVGLPASGKTTFLAALWELVNETRVQKVLTLHSIGDNDHTYLRKIVRVWRRAKEQIRTSLTGLGSVKMNLKDAAGRVAQVVIPDVPGEEFRGMWESRELGSGLGASLASGNIMLLINGDKIKAPAWITERMALKRAIETGEAEETPPLPREWEPSFAPTQVPLVDLLQHIPDPAVGAKGRRIVVMIGAWDKAEGEGLSPEAFLDQKLPFLSQYLKAGRDGWSMRVYGLSAQGGEYDQNVENIEQPEDPAQKIEPRKGRDADRLRDEDIAANRIRLVFGEKESKDLTEPLQWLMH